MTKEQQIEEMTRKMQKCYEKNGLLNFKWFAEVLYNAGYRKVPKGSFICSGREANLDIEVCNNCGMQQANELFERDKEIERLKAKCQRKQNFIEDMQVKKCGMKCPIAHTLVKEFAEKLKEKFDGYDATSYNGYEEGFHNLQEEIDELLKGYCND